MLRNFHYTDEKGKDQGINVRNRANELASMLSDVDKIRTERRKARANRNKYQGVEGGMFNTASGSRYGGFGSESAGAGGSSSRYGGSGGFNGGASGDDDFRGARTSSSGFQDSQQRTEYDEYEGADDFDERPPRTSSRGTASSGRNAASAPSAPPKGSAKRAAEPPKKVANLLDFDDDEPTPAPAAAPAAAAAPSAGDAFGDDDFDDFQSAPIGSSAAAPVSAAPAPAPPAASGANANLFALLDSSKPTASAPPSYSPSVSSAKSPLTSPPVQSPMSPPSGMGTMMGNHGVPGMGSMMAAAPQPQAAAAPAPKKAASAFDDLFSASLGAPQKPQAGGKKTIAEMEKEKATQGLWGATSSATSTSQPQAKPASSGFDDLLL